jgi:hypothetical protein
MTYDVRVSHLEVRANRKQWRAVLPVIALAITACSTSPQRPARLGESSYGCMSAVLREKVPADLPDNTAHCVASGLIARYCSSPEAYLASAGKEIKDLIGQGDAEWRDWRADRVGVGCARRSESDDELVTCCEQSTQD